MGGKVEKEIFYWVCLGSWWKCQCGQCMCTCFDTLNT